MTNISKTVLRPTYGAWLVLMAAVLWGTTGTSQALAPEAATPLAVGGLRLLVGGGVLLVWAGWRGNLQGVRYWPRRPLIVGGVGVAAYQLCFFAGLDRTGVAVGTIVGIGSAPVLAGLLDFLVLRQPLSQRWFIATGLALAGCMLLVLTGDSNESTVDPLGILLAVMAGASYATYTLAGKFLLDVHPPDGVVGIFFGLGALIMLPLLFTVDVNWIFEPNGAIVVFHLGIVATALALALFARGLIHVPSSTAVTLTLAEPLTAGILGVVVVGEALTASAVAGSGLLFAGLWWLMR